MIMPGSSPLDAQRVRNELTGYLSDEWNGIVDSDIDGEGSEPKKVDESNSRFGKNSAARKIALLFTVFSLISLMSCGLSSAQIVSDFNIDRDTIFKEFSATVTVTLTNPALYKSISVSHGFSIPSSVSGSCAVTGGDGSLYLGGTEQKTVTLHIENTGNLGEDVQTTFTYHVYDGRSGEIPFSKDVELIFKAGLLI